jgi:hypothetical protein
LAWTYLKLDQPNDANGAIKGLLKIMPHYTIALAAKVYVFRIDEIRNQLFDSLRKVGLPE